MMFNSYAKLPMDTLDTQQLESNASLKVAAINDSYNGRLKITALKRLSD